MSNPNASDQKPDFYVGYLPLPATHRKFVIFIVSILVIAIPGVSTILALSQRSPGLSETLSTQLASWEGTVFQSPYPMLIQDDGRIHLLIGLGKFGVHDQINDLHGQRCRVSGYALARKFRQAIQLDMSDSAIEQIEGTILPQPTLVTLDVEPSKYIGEIVDGKCYLGAMKPGDGKAHKSCATLCIRGGLPAMFISTDHADHKQLPLVMIDDSSVIPDQVLGYVGEPVQLLATPALYGELPVLNIQAESIKRWDGD